MQQKKLLVVGHSYNNFQKDSTDELSKYFENINVFVRHNPIAEISKYIPVPSLNRSTLDYNINLTNKPSNVNVLPTPIIYAPLDSQYKKLGEKHFRVVDKTIMRNDIKFDLVHSHFTWSAGYVGAKLKEKYGVPFVVTAHGYDIYKLPFKDEQWKKNIEYVLNSADCIITVSNSNLECIKKLDVSTPVKIIPNGFRNDLFYPRDPGECRKTLNLPIDKKIVLTVGELKEIKRHSDLIDAMVQVVKHREDVLCIIVGTGELETKLKKQIKDLGLEEYVKLVGGKPHDDIPLWMNACDVFVLPSLNEGNPTVMFECLGCGKPFIGTKVGGIPEIMISEDYGLLVEPEKPDELAEMILSGISTVWDYDKIKLYSRKFTWENIMKKNLEVYEKLLC
ncbi:glycosyltransferase [Methanococcoides methylutens]|uniref:glycosyltransferase n=1 Tax=Methanococcoides methylutens TaxID=2226 RepID=UPI0040446B1C